MDTGVTAFDLVCQCVSREMGLMSALERVFCAMTEDVQDAAAFLLSPHFCVFGAHEDRLEQLGRLCEDIEDRDRESFLHSWVCRWQRREKDTARLCLCYSLPAKEWRSYAGSIVIRPGEAWGAHLGVLCAYKDGLPLCYRESICADTLESVQEELCACAKTYGIARKRLLLPGMPADEVLTDRISDAAEHRAGTAESCPEKEKTESRNSAGEPGKPAESAEPGEQPALPSSEFVRIVALYRDAVQRFSYFDTLSVELRSGAAWPMTLHNKRSSGRIFLLFVSLILRTGLVRCLRSWADRHDTWPETALGRLSDIPCRKVQGMWQPARAVSAREREVLAVFAETVAKLTGADRAFARSLAAMPGLAPDTTYGSQRT